MRLGEVKEQADADLVVASRRGDEVAFGELVRRHRSTITYAVSRLTRDPRDREEVVQEAFALAWFNLPTFEDRSQFGSWIYRIAVNAAFMRLRRLRRTERQDGAGTHYLRGEPRRPDDIVEGRDLVESVLGSLRGTQLEVFVRRRVLGLSTEEVSRELRLSSNAVKTRLHRADEHLRDLLGEVVARI